LKVCAGCSCEFEESFKFCPECGRQFGDRGAERQLNDHLMGLKRQAGVEAALSRQVFSGNGLGNRAIGRVHGGGLGHDGNEWG
jgi:hypothetical protein